MVHVFCDESGGIAPSESYFALGAIALEPAAATRVIKTFRKAAKFKGNEVKGSGLTFRERQIFMSVLAREEGIGRGAAVVCAKGDQLADWAIGKHKGREQILYRHMLGEAFELLGLDTSVQGITADRGRYTHTPLDWIAEELSADVERLTGRRVPFGYRESIKEPGLQVVDVLCNIAGKLLSHGPHESEAGIVLNPMIEQNRLVIRAPRLTKLAPEWLTLQVMSL